MIWGWPTMGLFRRSDSETTERDMSNREETRSRATLNWTLSADALRPKEAPFGFIGQNPYQVIVPPGQGRIIKTGISANVPLMVFPTRTHADDVLPAKGGKPAEGLSWPIVVSPGEDIEVAVLNRSQHTALSVDDKEAIICIYPLAWSGTTDVA